MTDISTAVELAETTHLTYRHAYITHLKGYDTLYFPPIDFPRITAVTFYMYLLIKVRKKQDFAVKTTRVGHFLISHLCKIIEMNIT